MEVPEFPCGLFFESPRTPFPLITNTAALQGFGPTRSLGYVFRYVGMNVNSIDKAPHLTDRNGDPASEASDVVDTHLWLGAQILSKPENADIERSG